MESVTPIELEAIGRVAQLGELYDARSDLFIRLSLFKSKISELNVISTQNSETQLKYTIENTYNEKFNVLDLSSELKLSVLAGLFKLEGSGRFFNDTKTSARSVKASLIEAFSTLYEQISITDTNLAELVNMDILEQIDATHVVIGIQWGGRVFISVEDMNTENKDIQTAQGNMNAKMKKLAGAIDTFEGGAKIEIKEEQRNELDNFNIHVYGDILSDTAPQDIVKALELMKSAPSLLQKANKGRGKAIKYNLIPVNILRKIMKVNSTINTLVRRVDEGTVNNCVRLFDNMSMAAQRLNDAVNSVKEKEHFITKSSVRKLLRLQKKYDNYVTEVKKSISDNLILVRSGDEPADKLQKVINEANTSEYAWHIIDDKLNEFDYLFQELKFMQVLTDLEVTVLDRKNRISEYSFENYEKDIYVLFYSYENENNLAEAKNTLREMLKNKAEFGPGAMFAAINYELLNENKKNAIIDKSRISLYREGMLIEENYMPAPKASETDSGTPDDNINSGSFDMYGKTFECCDTVDPCIIIYNCVSNEYSEKYMREYFKGLKVWQTSALEYKNISREKKSWKSLVKISSRGKLPRSVSRTEGGITWKIGLKKNINWSEMQIKIESQELNEGFVYLSFYTNEENQKEIKLKPNVENCIKRTDFGFAFNEFSIEAVLRAEKDLFSDHMDCALCPALCDHSIDDTVIPITVKVFF